jgi:hypothetical protein
LKTNIQSDVISFLQIKRVHSDRDNHNQTTSISSYKLYYFNGRGRVEIARLIFAAVGQHFKDIRYDQSE